ncbi:hypothetical protein AY599_16820 [Leptolyngbya valderiana BDU 20041]|nr:hypothetical protein AY599_16820 [Leptolyngbya valderiana BDU 20041]
MAESWHSTPLLWQKMTVITILRAIATASHGVNKSLAVFVADGVLAIECEVLGRANVAGDSDRKRFD